MSKYRTEYDALGQRQMPIDALYGIHTFRANENFKVDDQKTSLEIIRAIVLVKKSCAEANFDIGALTLTIFKSIVFACNQILETIESYDSTAQDPQPEILKSFMTHPLQGGAGTSANMNVNEVIANLALRHLGHPEGSYEILHPINHVNLHQSTNDVYPTALKIALIYRVRSLSEALANLQSALQNKENEHASILKLGRTQLMDAVPITFGQTFGAFARAISRDRWRIYKAEERLREVNIGGTAIGTSINTSIDYIYSVTEHLQINSKLGISRADLLVDATQNADVFVEVSGLLKSLSTNLLKISNDLRLMNSGPEGGLGEITLESHQAGSTIMPGKVNPVICEMVNQICFKAIGADTAVTFAASSGQLELNPYLPLIGHELLGMLSSLEFAVNALNHKGIASLEINKAHCATLLNKSYAFAAVFIDLLGYDRTSEIAKYAMDHHMTLKEALLEQSDLTEDVIENRLLPSNLTQPKR